MAAASAPAGQLKVLTIGPPCGRIRELESKVTAINAKYGPFDALLCLGDLFTPYQEGATELPEEDAHLLEGKIQLPIPLYFALPPTPLHPNLSSVLTQKYAATSSHSDEEDKQPIEVVPGLHFLGKTGVYKIAGRDGKAAIRVAVAGGHFDLQTSQQVASSSKTELEELMNATLTSAAINRLLAHPSFREQATSSEPADIDSQGEPSSLAEARKQQARQADASRRREAASARPPIDVLLTTIWPAGITLFSNPDKLPHPTSRVWGAPVIAKLVRNGCPRYHFALSPGSTGSAQDEAASFGVVGLDGTPEGAELRRTGVFWEREPFANQDQTNPLCAVTRFVSLARFANEKKARWFMALNIAPADGITASTAKTAPKPPANTTPSPFAGGGGYGGGTNVASTSKRGLDDDELESGPDYRWQENKRRQPKPQNGVGSNGLPSKPNVPMPERPQRRVIPVGPEDCWFCLSNPQCAKHLIVAIGTEAYVAMPKGQLPPTADPLSPVPGGGHVLIIPIEHFPTLLGHPDRSAAAPIAQEMEAWRSALAKTYASFNATLVSWEICRTTGSRAGHMQSQVVPVPSHLANGLQDFFRNAATQREYKMIENKEEVKRLLSLDEGVDDNDRVAERSDYFRLDFGTDTTWLLLLPHGARFYLQFPRETLAAYLGVPDRADWRKCARTEAIETAEARAFKAAFDSFAEGVGE